MRWLVLCLLVLVGCEPIPDEPDLQKEIEKITTLGYLVASEPAPERSGVTVRKPGAYEGYTLFTLRSEPTALVIDMDGNVVRRWHVPGTNYWSRARPTPDGGLLVITSTPASLLRLDPEGGVVWQVVDGIHHDFEIRPNGHIYTLCNEVEFHQSLAPKPLIVDYIVEFDGRGRELRRVSILEAFLKSDLYRNWLMSVQPPPGVKPLIDLFHTNSIQVVDVPGFDDPWALVSIRSLNTVAFVDMGAGTVQWAMTGMWHRQHEARMLPNGALMVYDNQGHLGRSKVFEFDPGSQDVLWQYDDPDFFSRGAGTYQILPNNNVFITESMTGRLFEVTRGGEIVWEYINPMATADSLTIRINRAMKVEKR